MRRNLALVVGVLLVFEARAPAAPPAADTADDEAALKAATLSWLEVCKPVTSRRSSRSAYGRRGPDASACTGRNRTTAAHART